MAYLYNLTTNSTTIDGVFIGLISSAPFLTPMLLFFVFFIVFLGGIIRQVTKTGSADYPIWAVIASISTLLTALIMGIYPGVIRMEWLVITVVITIFSGVWLFLDRKYTEI